jgi:hypothetical protein
MPDIAALISDADRWGAADILALIFVGVGVVMEGVAIWLPKKVKESSWVVKLEKTGWLVLVLALAAEVITQLNKDASDARIISFLNDDSDHFRLALETERQKRLVHSLTKKEYDAIQGLKGKFARINFMPEANVAANALMWQLLNAASDAGIVSRIFFAPPGNIWTGTMIWSALADQQALSTAFTNGGIIPGWGTLDGLPYPDVPKDIPLIAVGERFPEMTKPYVGRPK